MKSALRMALAEAHEELERLTVKHERLLKENATLRARVKALEERVAELEGGHPPAPGGGSRP